MFHDFQDSFWEAPWFLPMISNWWFEGSEPRILSGIFGKMCWNPMGDLHSFGRTWGALGGKVGMKLMWCFSNVNVPGKLKGRDILSYNSWSEKCGQSFDLIHTKSPEKRERCCPAALGSIQQDNWMGDGGSGRGDIQIFQLFPTQLPNKDEDNDKEDQNWSKGTQNISELYAYLLTCHLLFLFVGYGYELLFSVATGRLGPDGRCTWIVLRKFLQEKGRTVGMSVPPAEWNTVPEVMATVLQHCVPWNIDGDDFCGIYAQNWSLKSKGCKSTKSGSIASFRRALL